MSNTYFAFRQFGVRQDRCAMKVGTDACIFGAWVPLPASGYRRILDIGAGTGLLALMLAQRCADARIDALEIDPEAAGQAAENAADSLFAPRIRVIHADAREYRSELCYDLIVSNPPFFSKSLKGPDSARNAARHDESLSIAELFRAVAGSLAENGRFALLMPSGARLPILAAAEAAGLYPMRRMDISERAGASPKRSCWLFGTAAEEPLEELFSIREGQAYSAAFRELLGPFYLRL